MHGELHDDARNGSLVHTHTRPSTIQLLRLLNEVAASTYNKRERRAEKRATTKRFAPRILRRDRMHNMHGELHDVRNGSLVHIPVALDDSASPVAQCVGREHVQQNGRQSPVFIRTSTLAYVDSSSPKTSVGLGGTCNANLKTCPSDEMTLKSLGYQQMRRVGFRVRGNPNTKLFWSSTPERRLIAF